MPTCERCKYAVKSETAMNSFICHRFPPTAFPLMGSGMQILGIMAMNVPITDQTGNFVMACGEYDEVKISIHASDI